MILLRESPKDRRGGVLHAAVMSKPDIAFANIDNSRPSGPFVQVADKLAMNRLLLREIETALQGRFRKLVRARCNAAGFSLFTGCCAGDLETAFWNPASRVEIWVIGGVARQF